VGGARAGAARAPPRLPPPLFSSFLSTVAISLADPRLLTALLAFWPVG
jgi:hypothetical protein